MHGELIILVGDWPIGELSRVVPMASCPEWGVVLVGAWPSGELY